MRRGDWMQVWPARRYWPLDPRPEDIHIDSIAHSLARQCRYGGHVDVPHYSVAEHSVHIARRVSEKNKLWALLHDGPETFVIDVIRPIKPYLANYKEIEHLNTMAMIERFNLPIHGDRLYPDEVKAADDRILVDEHAQAMAPGLEWGTDSQEPLGVTLEFWPARRAKREFLEMFHVLTEGAYA